MVHLYLVLVKILSNLFSLIFICVPRSEKPNPKLSLSHLLYFTHSLYNLILAAPVSVSSETVIANKNRFRRNFVFEAVFQALLLPPVIREHSIANLVKCFVQRVHLILVSQLSINDDTVVPDDLRPRNGLVDWVGQKIQPRNELYWVSYRNLDVNEVPVKLGLFGDENQLESKFLSEELGFVNS